MIELNKTYKRRVNSNVFRFNKTYCKIDGNIFRYATVTRLDLMNNIVYYEIIDKNMDDDILRTYPIQGKDIYWFTALYLKDTNHD